MQQQGPLKLLPHVERRTVRRGKKASLVRHSDGFLGLLHHDQYCQNPFAPFNLKQVRQESSRFVEQAAYRSFIHLHCLKPVPEHCNLPDPTVPTVSIKNHSHLFMVIAGPVRKRWVCDHSSLLLVSMRGGQWHMTCHFFLSKRPIQTSRAGPGIHKANAVVTLNLIAEMCCMCCPVSQD